MARLNNPSRPTLLTLVIGLLLGWLLIGLVRLAFLPQPVSTHYHANFLMILDNQPVNFSQDKYMEEVTSCAASGTLTPRQRAHQHNQNGGSVHIHTDGVSWGQFFQSLSFNLGSNYLVDDTGTLYTANQGKTVRYLLNGQEVQGIANTLIASEDRLLIAYGTYSADQLKELATTVPQTAHELNTSQDPASCAGDTHETTGQRLQRAFLF